MSMDIIPDSAGSGGKQAAATIDEVACMFAVRMNACPRPADHIALDYWLRESVLHRGAYWRACAMWHAAGLAQDDIVPDDAHAEAPDDRSGYRSFSRRGFIGIAATMVAAAGAGGSYLALERDETGGRRRVATRIGQIAGVTLPGGIAAILDTDTALEVARQSVMLLRGKAWFRVPPSVAIGFDTRAGQLLADAGGAAFTLATSSDDVAVVLVTEGAAHLQRLERSMASLHLTTFQQVRIDKAGDIRVDTVSEDDIDRQTAWRTGELVLSGDTLEAALTVINRYNLRQVVLAYPDLAMRRVVGRFSIHDPLGFARAAGSLFDVPVSERGSEIVLGKTRT